MTYADAIAGGSVALLPHSSNPFAVAWCSPDPRPVIFARQARLQRSLRRQLRREKSWVTTVDACFDRVVDRCRAGRTEQWLTDTLAASLSRLHQCGLAHSVEVWDGTELIGGTFGLQLGAVFSADSQFTERSGAGKVAVVALSDRFARAGGVAIDVQHDSAHVQLLGAQPISRAQYLSLLRSPIRTSPLDCRPEPVQRLAD
ncbi:leucyl/phenylalanyl-tRNA--protein transferase [Streptomyces sp. NPDC057889]|uniref:leucyl/phenylalanyl-tRNA--protein transferase n=1 Tax=unclassified Streptomyces TaxID=2593676 RepID=UPI0036AB9A10